MLKTIDLEMSKDVKKVDKVGDLQEDQILEIIGFDVEAFTKAIRKHLKEHYVYGFAGIESKGGEKYYDWLLCTNCGSKHKINYNGNEGQKDFIYTCSCNEEYVLNYEEGFTLNCSHDDLTKVGIIFHKKRESEKRDDVISISRISPYIGNISFDNRLVYTDTIIIDDKELPVSIVLDMEINSPSYMKGFDYNNLLMDNISRLDPLNSAEIKKMRIAIDGSRHYLASFYSQDTEFITSDLFQYTRPSELNPVEVESLFFINPGYTKELTYKVFGEEKAEVLRNALGEDLFLKESAFQIGSLSGDMLNLKGLDMLLDKRLSGIIKGLSRENLELRDYRILFDLKADNLSDMCGGFDCKDSIGLFLFNSLIHNLSKVNNIPVGSCRDMDEENVGYVLDDLPSFNRIVANYSKFIEGEDAENLDATVSEIACFLIRARDGQILNIDEVDDLLRHFYRNVKNIRNMDKKEGVVDDRYIFNKFNDYFPPSLLMMVDITARDFRERM